MNGREFLVWFIFLVFFMTLSAVALCFLPPVEPQGILGLGFGVASILLAFAGLYLTMHLRDRRDRR